MTFMLQLFISHCTYVGMYVHNSNIKVTSKFHQLVPYLPTFVVELNSTMKINVRAQLVLGIVSKRYVPVCIVRCYVWLAWYYFCTNIIMYRTMYRTSNNWR